MYTSSLANKELDFINLAEKAFLPDPVINSIATILATSLVTAFNSHLKKQKQERQNRQSKIIAISPKVSGLIHSLDVTSHSDPRSIRLATVLKLSLIHI